jgi:hypothetical protein
MMDQREGKRTVQTWCRLSTTSEPGQREQTAAKSNVVILAALIRN